MTVLNEIIRTERLFEQRTRYKRIKDLQGQIKMLAEELQSPGSVKLTDMPKSQNHFDKQGFLLSKKMELENELNRHIKNYRDEDIILNDVIDRISTLPSTPYGQPYTVYQDILRYMYMGDFSMKEINKLLNAYREDYEEREEHYLRNLYVWHDKALTLFEKCQK